MQGDRCSGRRSEGAGDGCHRMDHSRPGGWAQRQYPSWPGRAPVNGYKDEPGPAKSGGRRALSTGLCIFLLTVGAVLWFALPAGRHLGINLHVVGIIVVCAGLLGLVLRRLPSMKVNTDLLSRWVIPRGATGPGETLADDALGEEQPRPL
jgi:hypothetical protein